MKSLLLSILLAATALPALAAQPQLIRSTPANGETNVPLDIQVIRFYFDQNMKMNQWTFWMSDKGKFPPIAGPNDAPWRDPITCELSVGALEPNTTYAVQLNSESKQGFRSAELNEPLPTTVIFFRTGAARSPLSEKSHSDERQGYGKMTIDKRSQQMTATPTSPRDVAFALLTAYKAKDLDAMARLSTAFNKGIIEELKIKGSRHPRYNSIFGGHRMAAVNAWDGVIRKERIDSETEARVTFTDPDKEGNIIQVALVKEDGAWCFEDLAFDEVVVKMPVSGIKDDANGFNWNGNWLYDEPGLRVEVTFLDNKRYNRTTITGQQIERAQGRYSTENSILELTEDTGDIIRFPFRVKDSNTFEVQDEGEWVPIRRR